MKKILLFVLALSMMVFPVSCGEDDSANKKTDNTGNNNDSQVQVSVNEDFFKWDYLDENMIKGLTDEGKKQKTLIIPSRCEEILIGALSENTLVENISFENDEATVILPDDLFMDCTSLVNVDLPDSITSINSGMFFMCTSLTSIDIPEGVQSIEDNAFYGCESLQTVKMGNNVTVIEDSAFRSCAALTDINYSSAITRIGEKAFEGAVGLAEIELPNSLKEICDWAFYNCHGLSCVKIPEGVTSIGAMAFTYCDSLTDIYLPSSLTNLDPISMNQTHEITIHVKEGSLGDTNFDSYSDGAMTKVYY